MLSGCGDMGRGREVMGWLRMGIRMGDLCEALTVDGVGDIGWYQSTLLLRFHCLPSVRVMLRHNKPLMVATQHLVSPDIRIPMSKLLSEEIMKRPDQRLPQTSHCTALHYL